jgi:hypothetical protein
MNTCIEIKEAKLYDRKESVLFRLSGESVPSERFISLARWEGVVQAVPRTTSRQHSRRKTFRTSTDASSDPVQFSQLPRRRRAGGADSSLNGAPTASARWCRRETRI